MASLIPPFTRQTAIDKLKTAQKLWNTRDPARVAAAYTPDSIWRNRHWFVKGTKEIEAFLTTKWKREQSYRLRKELFAFENRRIGGPERLGGYDGKERWLGLIAVQFWYEYQDSEDGMKWKRCYGLEDWTYDEQDGGKMRKRMMSGNDVLLGREGDGIAVPEEGIEGRWYVDGVDVEDVEISEKHY